MSRFNPFPSALCCKQSHIQTTEARFTSACWRQLSSKVREPGFQIIQFHLPFACLVPYTCLDTSEVSPQGSLPRCGSGAHWGKPLSHCPALPSYAEQPQAGHTSKLVCPPKAAKKKGRQPCLVTCCLFKCCPSTVYGHVVKLFRFK